MENALSDKFDGITLNERLFVAGKLDDFYRLLKAGDINKITALMRNLSISDQNIKAILESKELSKY